MQADFMIVGAQKGGSSSMDAYLRQHPQVCLYPGKEAHFFDSEANFNGSPDYARYHAAFPAAAADALCGEATPIYMYWPGAIERIRAYNPRCRLIVLLRNPLRRAWSHWQMSVRVKEEHLSFSEAIRREEERIQDGRSEANRRYSYLKRGCYPQQIERIRAAFPASQVLFMKSEEFFADRQASMQAVCRFLGLWPYPFDVQAVVNKGDYAAVPSFSDQEFVFQKLGPEILQTEALLNWDCSDWLGPWPEEL